MQFWVIKFNLILNDLNLKNLRLRKGKPCSLLNLDFEVELSIF